VENAELARIPDIRPSYKKTNTRMVSETATGRTYRKRRRVALAAPSHRQRQEGATDDHRQPPPDGHDRRSAIDCHSQIPCVALSA
jgi:hypothetical protein